MKNIRIVLSALSLIAVVGTLHAEHSILVSAVWLNEHKQDDKVVILHVDWLRLDYDREHIPGASYLWPNDLAPNTPYGSMNVPDLKAARTLLRGYGISNDSHVVLYFTRNNITVTARMFLMLEYLGLKNQVSLLDGGMNAWTKAGYALTNVAPMPKKGKFSPQVNTVVVDKNYVKDRLKAPGSVIVDARFKRYYDGEPTGNPRNGHITGAANIPYNEMVDDATIFKPIDQLQTYFGPVARKDQEVVTYCFIGQTASVVYMAGRVLGYDIKLYDGSLEEWSRQDNLPMETSPTAAPPNN